MKGIESLCYRNNTVHIYGHKTTLYTEFHATPVERTYNLTTSVSIRLLPADGEHIIAF